MPFTKTSHFILLSSLSLLGLLLTQGYWLWRAFPLEEKYFDERVHLSLQAVTHQVLQQYGDTTAVISPVFQSASNQYIIALPGPISYAQLSEMLHRELTRHYIPKSYKLDIFFPQVALPLPAGWVDETGTKGNLLALTRSIKPTIYQVRLTFPYKILHVAQCLHLGKLSLFSLLLVGVTFAYGAKVLQQERQLTVLKRNFLNNMTHELKTPLANITLASEVLQNPICTLSPTKALHYASLIHKEAKRLEGQVSRVLEMARFEKGELKLELTTLDVHELIEEIIGVAALAIEQKGGTLTCELLARQPMVQADRHHLGNLLHNLLENAEKYSPQKPRITLTTSNVGHQVVIAVRDQGRGIGPERDLIFEPFFRSPSGDRHDTKGFGLGLSYVRKVVDAHGARIRLSSRPNVGSKFEVFLRCV